MRYYTIEDTIEVPKEVQVRLEKDKIIIKGPKGEKLRKIDNPKIIVELKENKLHLKSYFATRREVRSLNTLASHIRNDIEGVTKGFIYKLKAVYIHFPFKMKIQGDKFIIENFLGERANREIEIPKDVKVRIEGDIVIVESYDIEKAGNFAGLLEALAKKKVGKKDPRKFQDGIYIIQKP
ncbi:50S ribosomal protein L6 [Nanoarchaeota archaeon NZ13-N]|uniref:50S ribosomal protein L6 n=1 Tax=Candidatus Nanoclepta minutus TaxID=1940235 RepID=A0A397WMF6_9ARCH|nr:MAG: 50S ribosomal protein L6 [Nanoarchaeota archaeon NZ13-N]RIB35218.1 MAG: hypothetical protein BXU00_02720 [Candidatus Nanoclepta minutus]